MRRFERIWVGGESVDAVVVTEACPIKWSGDWATPLNPHSLIFMLDLPNTGPRVPGFLLEQS